MKISILGSYGEHNLGDEAICSSIIELFKSKDEKTSFVVFSHNPMKSSKIHKYKNVYFRSMIATGIRSFFRQCIRGEWKKSINLLKQSDLIIIGGGGLFYEKEVGHKGFSPTFIWFLRTLIFRFIVKKKYILFGVGVNKLSSKFSRACLNKICKYAKDIIVRDELSKNNLIVCGVKSEKITVKPDTAWILGGVAIPQQNRNNNKITIGIQLRLVVGVNIKDFKINIIAFMEILVESLNVEIKLFPMSFHSPDDIDLMNEIVSESNHQKSISIVRCKSPKRLMQEMSKTDILITMRFHGLILGTISRTIPISLGYASKTESLSEELFDGCGLPCFSVFDFRISDLVNAVKVCLENEKSIKESLKLFADKQKDLLLLVLPGSDQESQVE